jgi:hypothetical protein
MGHCASLCYIVPSSSEQVFALQATIARFYSQCLDLQQQQEYDEKVLGYM